MQQKQLSNGLYHALPWLYAGAGVLTLAALRSPLGALSGLILLGVAAAVWSLRARHRRSWRLDQLPPRESPRDADEHLPPLEWRSNFCCGNVTIDAQHKQLFDLCNGFIGAGARHWALPELVRLVAELVEHLSRHLRLEERLLGKTGQLLSEQDRESQRCLLSRAALMNERFRKGQVLFGDMASFVVYDLVVNHVVKDSSALSHGA